MSVLDTGSDIFASDNDSIQGFDLDEPAPPVDFASSAECLTGEVHRLAQVVYSLRAQKQPSSGENGTSQSVLQQLAALHEGQQQTLKLLRHKPDAPFPVNSVSSQTDFANVPVQRSVELNSSKSASMAITVETGKGGSVEKTSSKISKSTVRELFSETKTFDLEEAKRFCQEKDFDVFVVAAKLRRTFPRERKVWFRAMSLQRGKHGASDKKQKVTPIKIQKQVPAGTVGKARK